MDATLEAIAEFIRRRLKYCRRHQHFEVYVVRDTNYNNCIDIHPKSTRHESRTLFYLKGGNLVCPTSTRYVTYGHTSFTLDWAGSPAEISLSDPDFYEQLDDLLRAEGVLPSKRYGLPYKIDASGKGRYVQ